MNKIKCFQCLCTLLFCLSAGHILADLLMNEPGAGAGSSRPGGAPLVNKPLKRSLAQRDDDSSSDDEEAAAKRQAQALGNRSHLLESSAAVSSTPGSSARSSPVQDVGVMDSDDDDTDEEPMVKVVLCLRLCFVFYCSAIVCWE